MLTWTEKITLMTTKGMSWKEVQEMDKGLEEEKKNHPKEEPPKEEPPKEEPPKEEPPKEEPPKEGLPKEEPTEAEKKLLERVAELEKQLKDAQADNVHVNNETPNTSVSFDEQLNEMFKDIRI